MVLHPILVWPILNSCFWCVNTQYGLRTRLNNEKSVRYFQKGSSLKTNQGLGIHNVGSLLTRNTSSLYHRILKVNCEMRDLCVYDLAQYICHGHTVHGTILHRIAKHGMCPVKCAFEKLMHFNDNESDGVVDSLRHLLCHENYVKPWLNEYILTTLLTKSFLMFY